MDRTEPLDEAAQLRRLATWFPTPAIHSSKRLSVKKSRSSTPKLAPKVGRPKLLWNNAYWDLPRGFAALLDASDEIGDLTCDYIEIWKLRRHRQRFMRRVA
jgi:hypothetical protein